jgi:hypothetical protein
MVSRRLPVIPDLSLNDIFGTHLLYNPRPSFTPFGGLCHDPDARAAMTGGSLTVAGRMTTICDARVTGPTAQRLWELAGMDSPSPVRTFHAESDYNATLRQLADDGRQLVFQHVHPPGEVPETLYAIPPGLLADLNDKAKLKHFVPIEFVAPRTVVPASELQDLAQTVGNRRIVLKAGGPFPSGGGGCVVIVRDSGDWDKARSILGFAESIVMEELLDVRDNFCLNYFSEGASSHLLGASRQITDREGGYLGNWFEPESPPPDAAIAVGHTIMQTAISLGYRGIAGFDMVVDREDRLWVIDLNFRLNGSTPALMWGQSLWNSRPAMRAMKYISVTSVPVNGHILCTLESLVQSGYLFPLGVCERFDAFAGLRMLDLRILLFGESASGVRRAEKTLLRSTARAVDLPPRLSGNPDPHFHQPSVRRAA